MGQDGWVVTLDDVRLDALLDLTEGPPARVVHGAAQRRVGQHFLDGCCGPCGVVARRHTVGVERVGNAPEALGPVDPKLVHPADDGGLHRVLLPLNGATLADVPPIAVGGPAHLGPALHRSADGAAHAHGYPLGLHLRQHGRNGCINDVAGVE